MLFNNAGICGYGLAHELTEPAWDAMIDINLKGAWIVARHVIPHMIAARRGVIVNNSSIAGLRGMGRLSHYAASKWGLTGLTKSWAIELAPHDIRVVSIHPTGVDTPLNDGLAMLEGKTTQEIAERSAGNLQPVPWIEAQDVADAVVFLVSDKARYMTGTRARASTPACSRSESGHVGLALREAALQLGDPVGGERGDALLRLEQAAHGGRGQGEPRAAAAPRAVVQHERAAVALHLLGRGDEREPAELGQRPEHVVGRQPVRPAGEENGPPQQAVELAGGVIARHCTPPCRWPIVDRPPDGTGSARSFAR